MVRQLPLHLGWESAALTTAVRTHVRMHTRFIQAPTASSIIESKPSDPPPPPPSESTRPTHLRVYPDIALGILQQQQTASGRIWLLLRVVDTSGRGWLAEEDVRHALTSKRAPLKVCSWRYLRLLLAQGNGLFWERRNGRLWLRSRAKVAAALGIQRLQQKPVALPVSVLTARIGTLRAHLYATFHSSRADASQATAPISRAALTEITSVAPRIQRRYEKRARVRQQRNFAVGEIETAVSREKLAWQHGHALFTLVDHQGQRGRPGRPYLAWQLPNSYVGPHVRQAAGQRKRLNRQLTDLWKNGSTGNGQPEDERQSPTKPQPPHQRYFDNGRHASRAATRRPDQPTYWPAPTIASTRFWHPLHILESNDRGSNDRGSNDPPL